MRINPKSLLQGLLYLTPIALLALASCGGGGGGSSSTTTPVVAPTVAPTAGTPVVGCNAINLNWSAVAGATGYNVYGAASSVQVITSSNKLTATPDTATSYTDTSATLNTTRYYRITAVNSAGEGPGSNVVNGTITVTCSKIGGSIQGNPLNLSTSVSTLAGTAGKRGYFDGTGASAQFDVTSNVTTDGTNLYVADTGNNVIRKIVISTGVVTTLAGSGTAGNNDGTGTNAQFNGPRGITTDGTYLYVADTQSGSIRKIDASGLVTTITPIGTFNVPAAITYDGTNLYVADSGHNTVKMEDLSGTVSSTFALTTTLNSPQGITTDGTNLYVTSGTSIYQIPTATGTPTSIISGLTAPQGITTDGNNLYVANTGDHTIRMTPINSPALSIVAGASGSSGSADATVGTNARFNFPSGITTDGANLYITDSGNYTIRKIQ